MAHLWIRAEQRANEKRVGVTPKGAAFLIANGFKVTIEYSNSRIIPIDSYRDAGCSIARENSWPQAPSNAVIFGLKELEDDVKSLHHKHIMFGHAFKGQQSGKLLLKRFKADGGTLYDIEYLTNKVGKRIAAFGYWAGFAGAAVSLKVWLSQQKNLQSGSVMDYVDKKSLIDELKLDVTLLGSKTPNLIVIGALGRVGTGASDLCKTLGIKVTKWDMNETNDGGPFPEILKHNIFLNCILANKNTPIFFSKSDILKSRRLSVIGDISCDPDSDYNPIPIYTSATSWKKPSLTIHNDPPLSVMAIDNLPSLLPKESSIDFSSQLLPYLKKLDNLNAGIWKKAERIFKEKIKGI